MTLVPILLAMALQAPPTPTAPLTFGHFEVQWEEGWRLVQMVDPIRYAGPTAGVTVDLKDQDDMTEEQMRAAREKWRTYARVELPKFAQRHGEVAIPLTEEELETGYSLFSVGVSFSFRGQQDFGLLFVLVSPEGRLAQLAVEGLGDPKARYPQFRNYVATGRWRNEPPKT